MSKKLNSLCILQKLNKENEKICYQINKEAFEKDKVQIKIYKYLYKYLNNTEMINIKK